MLSALFAAAALVSIDSQTIAANGSLWVYVSVREPATYLHCFAIRDGKAVDDTYASADNGRARLSFRRATEADAIECAVFN